MVAVSPYMGGAHGSGVLYSACDVLEISVVRGVGGMCGMCMCLARGRMEGVGGEWVTGLGLGFTNSGGTWGIGICVCVGCGGVGGDGGKWGRLGTGSWRLGWCYVCVCCESGLSVFMAGPGICILC